MNRLALLTTDLAYGGAEVQVVELARRFRARGWEVRVITMLPPEAFVDRLAESDIPVFSLEMRRGAPDPRAIIRLAALLRGWQPDVLHTHMVHANLLGRIARVFAHVPVVISTAHSLDEGGRVRELLYRATDPLCDLTTNVSNAAVQRYVSVRAVPRNKVRLVYNGVDTERFAPNISARDRIRKELDIQEQFVWLAVGRFEPAKDHQNLLKAVSQLDEGILLLAGQGRLEQSVRSSVDSLGLRGRVRFLGVCQDIPALMNAADGYVMSSNLEGLPMVLLEAAAVGLPIVTTDVGGNREVVQDGRTGLVVPARDSEALSGAMRRLTALAPEQRSRMGEMGRDYVLSSLSLERVTDQWEAVYRECLVKKGIA